MERIPNLLLALGDTWRGGKAEGRVSGVEGCPPPDTRPSTPSLRGRRRCVLALGLLSALLPLSSHTFAANPTLPDYKAGDEAAEEVVTPIQLVVLNPVMTQERRDKAASRVPAVYRFDPGAADDVEEKFRASFARTREAFGETVQSVFNKRPLKPQALENPKFGRMLGSFQRKHRNFPLQTNLFELWALGESDVLFEAELVSKLRVVMRQYVRESTQTPKARLGPGHYQMILSGSTAADLPLTLGAQSLFVARSNVLTVFKAKTELQKTFAAEEQAVAKYLSGFLRTNCIFDETLTRETRRRKTEGIYATDHYESGQVLVKKGQRIDATVLAALTELRAKTAAESVRAEAALERVTAEATQARLQDRVALATLQAQSVAIRNRWLVAGLAGTSVLCLFALYLLIRHKRKSSSLLPVLAGAGERSATVSCPACNEPISVPLEPIPGPIPIGVGDDRVTVVSSAEGVEEGRWKDRALRAERRAHKTGEVLHAGLIPHLARWMVDKLVRGLLSDRRRLIAVHNSAADDVAALERRLIEMQSPLKDRLAAYERRIAELEKELAVKGEENRELIKAKIALARQQLERERSKGVVALN